MVLAFFRAVICDSSIASEPIGAIGRRIAHDAVC